MGSIRRWIAKLCQGVFAMFGLKVVRLSAYQATIARNQALEAQIAGFMRVMDQDYRLIHDLFQADERLQVDH